MSKLNDSIHYKTSSTGSTEEVSLYSTLDDLLSEKSSTTYDTAGTYQYSPPFSGEYKIIIKSASGGGGNKTYYSYTVEGGDNSHTYTGYYYGGNGGSGNFDEFTSYLEYGTSYEVVVGEGGALGSKGGSSSFNGVTLEGGSAGLAGSGATTQPSVDMRANCILGGSGGFRSIENCKDSHSPTSGLDGEVKIIPKKGFSIKKNGVNGYVGIGSSQDGAISPLHVKQDGVVYQVLKEVDLQWGEYIVSGNSTSYFTVPEGVSKLVFQVYPFINLKPSNSYIQVSPPAYFSEFNGFVMNYDKYLVPTASRYVSPLFKYNNNLTYEKYFAGVKVCHLYDSGDWGGIRTNYVLGVTAGKTYTITSGSRAMQMAITWGQEIEDNSPVYATV